VSDEHPAQAELGRGTLEVCGDAQSGPPAWAVITAEGEVMVLTGLLEVLQGPGHCMSLLPEPRGVCDR
jgi:hypothetical protein